MTNKEVAKIFNLLAKLMELHGENKFRTRSYSNAYVQIRKLDSPVLSLTLEELNEIKGIGKTIAEKIIELGSTGEIQSLEDYRDKTPIGVMKMLEIKGFGPKKIGTIWKDMGIATLGELLYACNENRLLEIKGFGAKTQADLKASIEFYLKSEHKYRYADIEDVHLQLFHTLEDSCDHVQEVGGIHRKDNEIECLEYVVVSSNQKWVEGLDLSESSPGILEGKWQDVYPVTIYMVEASQFEQSCFENQFGASLLPLGSTAADIGQKLGVQDWIPELKGCTPEHFEVFEGLGSDVIDLADIKGIIHTHTTYSDGIHSIEEMATACKEKGFEYLVISDHSQSAFYANGLKEEQLWKQWTEIDDLNASLDGFHIFKSIESDILSDGSLDYREEILDQFDLIIASVHSNLKMDEEKATTRLIKAIENPRTTILGHPTGRLILSRRGYPIDHQRIIDACAANGVVIELNANPWRLDIDWEWIPYAMSKGVMIAVNPDAHSIGGIDDIKWGVISAKKGGLQVKYCLNSLNLENFQRFLQTVRK